MRLISGEQRHWQYLSSRQVWFSLFQPSLTISPLDKFKLGRLRRILPGVSRALWWNNSLESNNNRINVVAGKSLMTVRIQRYKRLRWWSELPRRWSHWCWRGWRSHWWYYKGDGHDDGGQDDGLTWPGPSWRSMWLRGGRLLRLKPKRWKVKRQATQLSFSSRLHPS